MLKANGFFSGDEKLKIVTKKIFKKSLIMCIILICLFAFCSCTPNLTLAEEYELLVSDDTPTDPVFSSYTIDVKKLEEVVGSADNVFIAIVKEYKGTINVSVGTPATIFVVEVIENIKGNLIKKIDIELTKSGGLTKKRKSKAIYIGDIMPKVNEYYVFSIFVQLDGKILSTGPNSSIKIENYQNLHEDPKYKEFVEAYENEVVFDRERRESIYEQD